MDKPDESLGQRIRLAVERSGRSRGEICRHIGVERAYLNRAIKGRFKPGADKLLALARASGVSVDFLLGRSELTGGTELRESEKEFLELYRGLDKTTAHAVCQILVASAASRETLKHVRSLAAIVSRHVLEPSLSTPRRTSRSDHTGGRPWRKCQSCERL